MSSSSRKRKRNGKSAAIIAMVLLIFLIGLGVEISNVKRKDEEYTLRLQQLHAEQEDETQRSAEIDDLEEYMKSTEFVEDTAKSKLGLAYDNEIIFKENGD